jgi:hypothetical protein
VIDAQRLIDRLKNDRYDENQTSEGADPAIDRVRRKSWNAAMEHVADVIVPQLVSR